MRKITFIILALFLFIINLNAQDINKAFEYFNSKQYEEAAKEFEALIPNYKNLYGEKDTTNLLLYYYIQL